VRDALASTGLSPELRAKAQSALQKLDENA
jgi:hypothetical protein